MPKIYANDGLLTVDLSLGERLRTGRTSLSVELWRVGFIQVDDGELRDKLGRQEEGRTGHVGVFVRRSERSFVFWPKRTPAIVVQVSDPVWNRIVIGDANAKEIASKLRLDVAKAKAL